MNNILYATKITNWFVKANWIYPCDQLAIKTFISNGTALSDTGRQMMLDLLDKFYIVEFEQFLSRIMKVLDAIPQELWDNIEFIYINRLEDPKDIQNTKSSDVILSLFRHRLISNFFTEHGILLRIDKNLREIKNQISIASEKYIFLVDDFIGSGNTAIKCINHYQDNGIPIQKIKVLTMAAMEEGIHQINDKGVHVYTGLELKKGISDITDKGLREKYTNEMTKLEKDNALPEYLHFGFEQTESLISFIRTPNDVFPVFWSSESPYAIFKRFQQ